MKYIIIFLVSLYFSAAQAQDKCEDISSHCLHASKGYMGHLEGKKFCSGVATNCFYRFNLERGFYEGRDQCFNVSSNCFEDVSVFTNKELAASACSNVSTVCYANKKAQGFSIKESINRCSDVYVPCRTCGWEVRSGKRPPG